MQKYLTRAFLVFTLIFNTLYGGGFQINEQGARAMGMAGAFTALALDPSAIYFNPAGLSNLKGTQFMFGSTLIMPKTSFRGVLPQAVDETKMNSQIFTPINFYATQQLSDKLFIGLGVNNPYGLGTEWAEDWVGKYVTTKIDLKTFFISPVISYKFSDDFSIGVGVDYAYASVDLQKKVDLAPFYADAKVKLSGTGNGFGFRAGLLAQLSEQLSFGLSFRSNVKLNFTGTAESTAPSQMASRVPAGAIKTSITTPMNITAGIAYRFCDKLVSSFDFQYVGWTSYDKLVVEFTDRPEFSSEQIRDYIAGYFFRWGIEYDHNCYWAFRGGVFYDKNPVKDEYVDPLLPDANRIGLNLGLTFKISRNIRLEFAYLYMRFTERNTDGKSLILYSGNSPLYGVYNSTANLFGFNLSFNF